ncbi:MAG: RNA polymerase sigma factor [Gammaproteobacteria bacterium]
MSHSSSSFTFELTRLIPRLHRYAYVLTHNKSDSDDLVQAALERAIIKQHQWKDGTQLDRWTFTILASIWKNELRARTYRRGNGVVDADNLEDQSAQSSLERTFLLNQVFNQTMALPENQRELILLIYVEGFQYQEAANILEIPVGTVMSRLARARINLAAQLEIPARKKQGKA